MTQSLSSLLWTSLSLFFLWDIPVITDSFDVCDPFLLSWHDWSRLSVSWVTNKLLNNYLKHYLKPLHVTAETASSAVHTGLRPILFYSKIDWKAQKCHICYIFGAVKWFRVRAVEQLNNTDGLKTADLWGTKRTWQRESTHVLWWSDHSEQICFYRRSHRWNHRKPRER